MAYTTVDRLRAAGITPTQASDARLRELIAVATATVDGFTGRHFEPRPKTVRIDGTGKDVLLLNEAIVEITGVAIRYWNLDAPPDPISVEDVVVYNRHLVEGLLDPDDRENPRIATGTFDQPDDMFFTDWSRGRKNIEITGWFGYTDPVPARLTSVLEPFALSAGDTLEIEVDGAEAELLELQAGDIAVPGEATAVEVARALARDAVAFEVSAEDGRVVFASRRLGLASALDVVGGTAAAVLAFPVGPGAQPRGVTPALIVRATELLVVRDLPPLPELDDRDRRRRLGRVTNMRTRTQSFTFAGGATGSGNQHQQIGHFTGDPEIDNILALYARPLRGGFV